ncbi:MAG: hypothetical protein CL476_12395 [Acidobacteria bacterium]|jgi:hypothetical protein|nr:hypothetical protein [Acidobacteriota bacterium]|tara:strand:+ start:418 stop:645 length:228 start_codon:yes stop_codon:yes gene_type:complete
MSARLRLDLKHLTRTISNARPLCEAAAAKGVILGPGDCFGRPSHLRIGFGACTEGFDDALALTAEAVRESLAVAS